MNRKKKATPPQKKVPLMQVSSSYVNREVCDIQSVAFTQQKASRVKTS